MNSIDNTHDFRAREALFPSLATVRKGRQSISGCSVFILGAAAFLACFPLAARMGGVEQEAPSVLEALIVTVPPMADPMRVETDPRQPRLTHGANDGGAYLKSIPGIALSRKGGISGDPELRGLGGSRLGILTAGTKVMGGCGGRMDPPTAYVYPESYDNIVVIKGPQSVAHGALPAGLVKFERRAFEFDRREASGGVSLTTGSFGRTDMTAFTTAGLNFGYLRVNGGYSEQGDYRDGTGERIHSAYKRWNGSGTFAWTPGDDTTIEFTYDRSDGEAAYDDRRMDGVSFDRTGFAMMISHDNVSPFLRSVVGELYSNKVDHVMDNYSLVPNPPMMKMFSNPIRRVTGGRLELNLTPSYALSVLSGVEVSDDRHSVRRGNSTAPRADTVGFIGMGVFAEVEQEIDERRRAAYGLRMDRSRARVLAEATTFGGAGNGVVDASSHWSGFMRYIHDLENVPVSIYTGLGRAVRAPDFWERGHVFDLRNESLTQLDVGFQLEGKRIEAGSSAFYGRFDDFILIGGPHVARNIKAVHYGAEADATLRMAHGLSTTVTFAWVHARNLTDGKPLAQTPPMEGTVSLDHTGTRTHFGAMVRAAAGQKRVHEAYGTIYSVDTEPTSGFAVVSVYGGYRLKPYLTLTAGIENAFDRTYVEHLQRGLADLGTSTRRIHEPGRTFWTRISADF